MNFQLFLAASKISDEEFLSLSAVDKSLVYANFSKTETGKQALPIASMPTLTVSDAKLDTEVKAEEDDEELDQCYHRLIHSKNTSYIIHYTPYTILHTPCTIHIYTYTIYLTLKISYTTRKFDSICRICQ